MGSRREEERNEKIIRGLMKLPPNRRCINCNNLGPQYVCTNFWTFVCMTCSGIHREFTHRVKSVSMAKFTSEEVDALQRGGNQRARELYLKAWDPNKQRLPDNSNANKVREFIKNVYVEKRYAAEMSLDRPPRDPQNMQNQEEMRRTSSYHFYSQSPPYDFQYGERHSGKRVTSLFRKPRSDHVMYKGSFSTFSSPNRMSDCGSDESFENKGIFQRSFSTNDAFKCSMLSPSPQRDIGSPLSETSSCVSRDTPWHPVVQSNSVANNGNNEGRTMHQQEVISKHVRYLERPHAEASSAPPSMLTTFSGVDLLSEPIAPESVISTQTTVCKPQLPTAPAVDSFQQSPISSVPTFSEQQLVTSLTSQTCDVVIHSNGEWMTFDNPQNSMLADASILAIVPSSDRKFNPFSDDHNSSNDSTGHENSASTYTIWDASLQKLALATNNNQFCNAFEETSGQQPIQSMLNNSHQDAEELSYSDANKSLGFPVALNNDGIVKTSDDIEPPAYSYSHYNVGLHDFSVVPAVAGQHSFATEHKPTNPFELPFFADSESSNMASFWDMSLLQSALPNNHMAAYGFDASQSWFPENTVLQSYVPDGGPFGFMVGQVPSVSISSFHAQGPVAYVGGGNPFA